MEYMIDPVGWRMLLASCVERVGALAVTFDVREAALPGLMTLTEQSLPGIIGGWSGLSAPTGFLHRSSAAERYASASWTSQQ